MAKPMQPMQPIRAKENKTMSTYLQPNIEMDHPTTANVVLHPNLDHLALRAHAGQIMRGPIVSAMIGPVTIVVLIPPGRGAYHIFGITPDDSDGPFV